LTNTWISDRERHYKDILDFFADKPNQLLIINIEKPKWETVVATFIQKPTELLEVHSNKRELNNETDKIVLITDNVIKCLKQRGYNGSELLLKDFDITSYRYTSYL